MNELLEQLPAEAKKKLKKESLPTHIEPMLAYLTKEYFSDPEWIYERKFDGERCIAFKEGDMVRLRTRNDKPLNENYPEVEDAMKALKAQSIILDGEVVAFSGELTSFERLQGRLGVANRQEALASGIAIYYYVFDILYFDGYSITSLPLEDRKKILKNGVDFNDPLRYTIHKDGNGIEFHKEACEKGWEGIMAKDRHSPYVHKRSQTWLKFKCVANQELVIGGFTDPEGSRIGFGALLLGYYENGKFKYAGRVGTGFNDALLRSLRHKMDKLATDKNPFDSDEPAAFDVHWVKPELVAEIGFEEWTRDHKLRQPRFQGLRNDKAAKDVRREVAE